MIWTTLVILPGLWSLAYIGQVGGGFIHLLLFVTVIAVIYHVFNGRRVV